MSSKIRNPKPVALDGTFTSAEHITFLLGLVEKGSCSAQQLEYKHALEDHARDDEVVAGLEPAIRAHFEETLMWVREEIGVSAA